MKVTKHNSSNAAENGHLPEMELVLSSAKELGKEMSYDDFCRALYQMYCA